jgi:hypothetical protein
MMALRDHPIRRSDIEPALSNEAWRMAYARQDQQAEGLTSASLG